MNNIIALHQREPEPPEPAPNVNRAEQVMVMIGASGTRGMTWRELSKSTGLGHGSVSAILSTLHGDGKIDRLRSKREGSKVYVLPMWVLGRETSRPYRTRRNALLDDMAEVLKRVPAKCTHYYVEPGCRSCEIKRVLRLYDDRQY